ncbi:hypothetical protein B484DRAFT_408314 [Ochromonadaceae sp. CCMP2298]|nr:hypothetical protein B484DRAFT_408314 [Ochromonadaceae sp. CCMP2298]
MLAIWVLLIACARAEIIQYSNHVVIGGRPEYLVIPKFDSLEVPHWEPGRGRSFIDLSDVKIRLPCNTPGVGLTCRNAVFEVLMFEAPKFGHWMDHWANGEYCCSQEAADAGRCPSSRVNQLITPPSLPGFFLRSTTVKAKETADLTEGGLSRNSITASGQYVMLMAVCDAGAMPVVIDGSMESIDPYGYVPAASFGAMPFNLALSLCYLAVALAWAVLCYWFRDSMISLQGWISAVMLIAMVTTE